MAALQFRGLHVHNGFIYILYNEQITIFASDATHADHVIQSIVLPKEATLEYLPWEFHREMVVIRNKLYVILERNDLKNFRWMVFHTNVKNNKFE